MGGLITRAYIQGDHYDGDIDKLAMVGTPNHGSAMAYFMWEGGDPPLADKVGADGFLDSTLSFYTQTTDKLHFTTYGIPIYPSIPFYTSVVYKLLHDKVPSLRQLLPTNDRNFLSGHALSCDSEQNDWLTDVNKDVSAQMGDEFAATGKIKTKIFAGKDQKTLKEIQTGKSDCSKKFYKDGEPLSDNSMIYDPKNQGDGTVLTNSALLGGLSYTSDKSGAHAGLINEYLADLVQYVDDLGRRPSLATPLRGIAAPLSTNELSINVIGGVQPYIVDPNGRKSGIKPADGTRADGIPNATISLANDGGSILLQNAMDGIYTLYLKGIKNEDFGLSMGYSDGVSDVTEFNQGFNHANTTSFSFTVNSTSTEKLTVNKSPLAPTGLQADAVNSSGLKTVLSWKANTDAGVTGYNVYAKYDDEPYLAQIGTSVTNSFNTGDAWAKNATIKTRLYAVAAVNSDGTESFLSNMAENNDRDHDGLTDEQETTFGTKINNPDSDGDGLKDGEEYSRGTNPLLADTDGDGYNDNAEVINGSDPLDPESTPVPAAPAGLSVKAIASDSIVLAWKDASYNEKGFKIERKEGACDSANTWAQIAVKGANISTHTNTGLTANTTYSYQVKAYNTGFSSAYSNCSTATTGKAGTPHSPTGLTATSTTVSAVTLKWADVSTDETRFEIWRKAGAGTFSKIGQTAKDIKTYQDATATGNDAATGYQYYIRACNVSGCSPNTSIAVVPFRPSDLSATIDSGIKLTWTDNSANETGFQVYRKAGACSSTNTWELINTTAANSETYTDTGMAAGQYSYHVRAYFKSTGQPLASGYSMFTGCLSKTAP